MRKIYQTVGKARNAKEDVLLTRWCGYPIARSHSLLQKINQIVDHHIDNALTTISIRGKEGTGKTTLARILAHELHTRLMAQRPKPGDDQYRTRQLDEIQRGYCVRVFQKDDLREFKKTLLDLPPQNRILIFDDLSFIGGNVNTIKSEVTEIRHHGDVDYKTILIYNFHYNKGFDKYLRDTHYIFSTSVSVEEQENMGKVMGGGYKAQAVVKTFTKYYMAITRKKQCTVIIDKDTNPPRAVTYYYSRPFRLALFFDGIAAKLCVFPEISAVSDPLKVGACGICTEGGTAVPAKGLIEWMKGAFGQRATDIGCRNAVISKLGFSPVERRGNTVTEVVNRMLRNGALDFGDLMESYCGVSKATMEKYVRKQVQVPEKHRQSFFLKFGVDGLRAPSDKGKLHMSDVTGGPEA